MASPTINHLAFEPAQPILAILTGNQIPVTQPRPHKMPTVALPPNTTIFSPSNANTLNRLLDGTARLEQPSVAPLPETTNVSIYGDITLWPFNISLGIQSKNLNDPSEPPTLYGMSVGASSPQEPQHLAGLELALFPDRRGNVYGAQIGLFNTADEVNGLSLGLMNSHDATNGVAISFSNHGRRHFFGHINGLSLAIFNQNSIDGVALALINLTAIRRVGIHSQYSRSSGLLLGAINLTGHMEGVQFGILSNVSHTHMGLSVGLINTIIDPDTNTLFQLGFYNHNNRMDSFLVGADWKE